ELPSGYLAARFQHSWPTTTRHLAVLEKAGLIAVRRVGRSAFYRLNRQHVRQVVEAWLRHLHPVGPAQTWAPAGPRSTAALRQQTHRTGPVLSPTDPRPPPWTRRSSFASRSRSRISTRPRPSTRGSSEAKASATPDRAITSTAAA